ncbi:MAG: hypothetical protein DCC65_10795 [Planctomycetota bacterium]|nr:MAG: hypothetical protein DCC65_10795 [Planctomycetota bacterium]
MVVYLVNQSNLARIYSKRAEPSETELFAILVALMALPGSARKPRSHELVLTEENRLQVAEYIREKLSVLLPEFEWNGGLLLRLYQLVGLRIQWTPF